MAEPASNGQVIGQHDTSHIGILGSDRMLQPMLFLDRISNSTNLFRPEPNQTQDIRIC